MSTDIQKLAAAQKKSLMANLSMQRDTALSDLTAEQGKIAPLYEQAGNAQAAQSAINAKNFAEYMAGRGLSAGTGAQWNMMNTASLQGTLGALERQQAADLSDIERRRTGVLSTFNSGLAAGSADIEAQMLEREISARHSGGGGGGGGYTYVDPVTGKKYTYKSYNDFLADAPNILKDEQEFRNAQNKGITGPNIPTIPTYARKAAYMSV